MVRRILFVTDLHEVRAFLPALVEAEAGADLCVLGGDLTNFSGPAEALAALAPLGRAFPAVRAVPGNVDRPGVARLLEAEGISLHGRGEALGGLWLSGVGGSNLTPLHGPTEYEEDEITALLQAGAPPASLSPLLWILVTHVPPRATVTDRMFAGKHVGSTALRAFLEAASPEAPRPALNLCGHIHEGIGQDRVGDTRICNPGAFTAGRYARIFVEDGDDPRGGDGRLRVELAALALPRGLRLRAAAQMIASKVIGYARHRLSP
jgi:hypothetical protein